MHSDCCYSITFRFVQFTIVFRPLQCKYIQIFAIHMHSDSCYSHALRSFAIPNIFRSLFYSHCNQTLSVHNKFRSLLFIMYSDLSYLQYIQSFVTHNVFTALLLTMWPQLCYSQYAIHNSLVIHNAFTMLHSIEFSYPKYTLSKYIQSKYISITYIYSIAIHNALRACYPTYKTASTMHSCCDPICKIAIHNALILSYSRWMYADVCHPELTPRSDIHNDLQGLLTIIQYIHTYSPLTSVTSCYITGFSGIYSGP